MAPLELFVLHLHPRIDEALSQYSGSKLQTILVGLAGVEKNEARIPQRVWLLFRAGSGGGITGRLSATTSPGSIPKNIDLADSTPGIPSGFWGSKLLSTCNALA